MNSASPTPRPAPAHRWAHAAARVTSRAQRTTLDALWVRNLSMSMYRKGAGAHLVILLHGFPDDAASMLPLMERLSAPHRTVVAPYMRGLAPTGQAPDDDYSLRALARDVVGLMDALGHTQATVIGHHWGALVGYTLANLAPQRVRQLVALNMPPPRVLLRRFSGSPIQWLHSAHVALFQVPGVSTWALQRDDFKLVDALWRMWSPTWRAPASRRLKVKSTLRQPQSARAALKYYRSMGLDALVSPQAWRHSLRLAKGRIRVPTLIISGEQDGCMHHTLFRGMHRAFETPSWRHVSLSCGHFPQHEDLDALVDALEPVLTQKPSTAG